MIERSIEVRDWFGRNIVIAEILSEKERVLSNTYHNHSR